MKKDKIILFVFICSLIFFLIYFLKNKEKIEQVCFSEKCVDVEVVDTPETRAKGLMFREYLDENSGMLFIFQEEDIYPFWMKNTLIPLDMIWISQDMKVVDIKTATPCKEEICPTYSPSGKALYVLEVNAGFAERNRIEVEEIVRID